MINSIKAKAAISNPDGSFFVGEIEVFPPQAGEVRVKVMAAGLYASFHHPLMMHGSYANSSERSRRAVAINAMGDDTLGNTASYECLDALTSFPPMPQDQILDSKFSPKLFPDQNSDLQAFIAQIPTIND